MAVQAHEELYDVPANIHDDVLAQVAGLGQSTEHVGQLPTEHRMVVAQLFTAVLRPRRAGSPPSR